MAIRILCVFGLLDRGGAETMCMNLYRHIDKNIVQFDFVKHSSKLCVFEEEISRFGGRIFEAPKFNGSNIIEYRSWWKKHLIEHPEHMIIHAHMFTTAPFYFDVAHKLGRITVCHSHSTSYNEGTIKKLVWELMKKRLVKMSDYRFACSRAAGEYMFAGNDYILLNNAIDLDTFSYNQVIRDAKREELGINANEKVVIIVANFVSPKNPIGAIDLFQKMRQLDPTLTLIWAGYGPLQNATESHINSLGLENNVKLLGTRSDVADLLQAADLFMMPSFFEGLPVAAIEAQASGLPCLLSEGISQEAAITDICKFAPIDNSEQWCEMTSRLLTLPRINKTEELTLAGYNIQKTSAWLQNFYLSIEKEHASHNVM